MQAAKRGGLAIVLVPLMLTAQPARAEVISVSEDGFVARLTAEVTATPAETWKTLINPALWWSRQHTFSGDSANLTLDPMVGGCFCETLPRPEGTPAAQKTGGVQHMRVVYIEPPRAMRLSGALGPLQSEALAATMTMTVKPTDKGARILFEYVVGGFMRYKSEDIAPAVDRMLTVQIQSLAAKLGPLEPVSAPKPGPKLGPPESDADLQGALAPQPSAAKPIVPLGGAEDYRLPPARSVAPAVRAAPRASAKVPTAKPATPRPADAETLPAKPALPAPAKPPAKPVSGAPAKAADKPAARAPVKAPTADDEARREANAAFDALLGASPAP